jgi:hypothetical protein
MAKKQGVHFLFLFSVAALAAVSFAALAQRADGYSVVVSPDLLLSAEYDDLGEIRAVIPMSEVDAVIREFIRTPGLEESSKARILSLANLYTGFELRESQADEALNRGVLRSSAALLPGRMQVTGSPTRGYQLDAGPWPVPFEWFYRPGQTGVFELISQAQWQPALRPDMELSGEGYDLRPLAEFLVSGCRYRTGPHGLLRSEGSSLIVSVGGFAEADGCEGFLSRAPRSIHQFLPGASRESVGRLMRPLEDHGIYRPDRLGKLRKVTGQLVIRLR